MSCGVTIAATYLLLENYYNFRFLSQISKTDMLDLLPTEEHVQLQVN